MADILIFTPTFNEAGNIAELVRQVFELNLSADMLVIDDGSPDGTGQIVEGLRRRYPRLSLIQRGSKQGIGGAHLMALRYAKARPYRLLVSLDADFSHDPSDIPRLLALSNEKAIVVGTRFEREDSLGDWNLYRKSLTRFGHFLTRTLLGIPFDASGGLRVYDLAKVPLSLIETIGSRDYEFFFESLTLMHRNGLSIGEVPIALRARTYGHSKMRFGHIVRGVHRLLRLSMRLRFSRRLACRANGNADRPDAAEMREAWNVYWQGADHVRIERSMFDVFARFYRNYLMTALDISPKAIQLYQKRYGPAAKTVVGDIFDLSRLQTFDGIYNLGVMEHFSEAQIEMILCQFCRRVRPGGKIVLFWPPVYGLSVLALHAIHFVLNAVLRRNIALHPPEPTKVRSRRQVARLLRDAGFELTRMTFGPRDAFTYVVVVATRRENVATDALVPP